MALVICKYNKTVLIVQLNSLLHFLNIYLSIYREKTLSERDYKSFSIIMFACFFVFSLLLYS